MHFIIKTKEPPESDAVRARLLFYYRPKAGVNISPLVFWGEASEESPIARSGLSEPANHNVPLWTSHRFFVSRRPREWRGEVITVSGDKYGCRTHLTACKMK